jgi:hypothetical protein
MRKNNSLNNKNSNRSYIEESEKVFQNNYNYIRNNNTSAKKYLNSSVTKR